MSKPYIYLEEAMAKREPGRMSVKLLTEEQGCVAGCCSGISFYNNTEYRGFSFHADQEGFYVLEGEGFASVDSEEFEIFPGTSFVVPAGVMHSVRCKESEKPVKVFWFHSAI